MPLSEIYREWYFEPLPLCTTAITASMILRNTKYPGLPLKCWQQDPVYGQLTFKDNAMSVQQYCSSVAVIEPRLSFHCCVHNYNLGAFGTGYETGSSFNFFTIRYPGPSLWFLQG